MGVAGGKDRRGPSGRTCGCGLWREIRHERQSGAQVRTETRGDRGERLICSQKSSGRIQVFSYLYSCLYNIRVSVLLYPCNLCVLSRPVVRTSLYA